MRRSFLKLLVPCLLLLAVVSPSASVPPPPGPAYSATADWSALAPYARQQLDLTDFYAWASAQTTTTTVRRVSTVGSMVGDRFDRLAMCESGGDPAKDTGNGFYGAFQWLLSTWHAAGGSGNPVEHSYAEQKAIAMSWAQRANPYTQWPVCWPRSA